MVPNPEVPQNTILAGEPETILPVPEELELDRAKLLEERICDRLDEDYNVDDPNLEICVPVNEMPSPTIWDWLRGRFTAWDLSWNYNGPGEMEIVLKCK